MNQESLPHFTVSRISDIIKNTLEQTFPVVNVMGEVSNLSINSKYAFFSIKDSTAILRCACWTPAKLKIENGDSIVATGKITTYKGGSSYQLTVYRADKQGIGNLAKIFQELKDHLQKEGIFDQIHKREIAPFTQNIALISANNSAALEDVLVSLKSTIVQRTYFLPATMQGKGCALSVISAIKKAQTLPIDAIIIARGGGSFEDLNEFNNEPLTREVFACNIPIISAIGHEVDFTMLDFVADVRAITPTASAKIVSPQKSDVLFKIQTHRKTIEGRMKFELQQIRYKIDALQKNIVNYIKMFFYTLHHNIQALSQRLSSKVFIMEVIKVRQKIELLETKNEQIDPKKVMNQGFAMLESNGKYYDDFSLLPRLFTIITKNGKMNAKKLDN
ncbi:MAG: exodeoxyribonuclease VII large subunit [Candidatus Deianiraeaceae bacterium]|jgi:exodeoxyribonuclease VII large subunit